MSALAIGDVYSPRAGSGYCGRVVVDHVIRGRVYGHSVWAGTLFEADAARFAGNYERDAAWCDGTMGAVEHPGMNGEGI